MSDERDVIGLADRAIAVINKITPRSIAMAMVTAALCIVGYTLWEQRILLATKYFSDPGDILTAAFLLGCIVIGLVLWDMNARIEQRAEHLVQLHADSQQRQIDNLQDQNRAQQGQNDAQQGQIDALVRQADADAKLINKLQDEHTACERRLDVLRLEVERFKR